MCVLAEDKQGVLAKAKSTTVFKEPLLKAEQDGKMVEWFKAPVLVAQAERGFSRGQTRRFGKGQSTTVFKKPHLEAEQDGKMVEWFKAPVLKTGVGAPPPRVRIPLFPPLIPKKWG